MAALSAAASGTGRLLHAVGFYGSDEEFVRTFAPVCEAAVQREEPTVVRLDTHKSDLLRSALDDPSDIHFLGREGQYPHPPGAMESTLDLVDRHLGGQGKPLLVIGELPSLTGLSRDAWLRYEAAVNHTLQGLLVHPLCACDTRATPQAAQSELLRAHHAVISEGGQHLPNGRFEPPETFIANRRQDIRDPLEHGRPAVELKDPSPSAARQAVGDLARSVGLDEGGTESLLLGVSEVIANAILHGMPPILLYGWGARGRVAVAVRDLAAGPADPFAGLLPVEPGAREGGLGLWITHQMCPEISLSSTEEGFTVRLAAGTPSREPAHT